MMISNVPERARSPTQMSPLLQKLVDKHGTDKQKLISEVIYKYAIKGIKLRDLQFSRLDKEITQTVRQREERNSQLRKSKSPQQKQYDMEPAANQGKNTAKNTSRLQFIMGSPMRLDMPEGEMHHHLSPVPTKTRTGSVMQTQISPGGTTQEKKHQPRYGGKLSPRNDIAELAGFNLEALSTLDVAGETRNSAVKFSPRNLTIGNGSQLHSKMKLRNRQSSAALPNGSSGLSQNFNPAQDLKTGPQRRDETLSVPKTKNVWDMLTLQDTIRKQQEDKATIALDRSRKQQMKDFYDMQVAQKREVQKAELVYEQQVRSQIEDKVLYENDRDKKLSYKHAEMRRVLAKENLRTKANTIDVIQRQNDWIKTKFQQKKEADEKTAKQHSAKILEKELALKRAYKDVSLQQIVLDEARIRTQKQVEKSIGLRDLIVQDRTFQVRDENLYQHRSSIYKKGVKMEKYFQNPAIMTHTRQEVVKDAKVRTMQERFGKSEQQREDNIEKQRIERLHTLKCDMMAKNQEQLNFSKDSRQNQLYQRSVDRVRDNEKFVAMNRSANASDLPKLDSSNMQLSFQQNYLSPRLNTIADHQTLYNQKAQQPHHRETTQRQANHQLDIVNYQKGTKEKQRLLRSILDHQVNEKTQRREKERLYKDQKELATSKQMLRAVHPLLAASTAVVTTPFRMNLIGSPVQAVHASQKGDLAEMGNDANLLNREVNRLYNIVNKQDRMSKY